MEAVLTEAKTENKMFGTKIIEVNWIVKEDTSERNEFELDNAEVALLECLSIIFWIIIDQINFCCYYSPDFS
jgi:hypothetical protein